MLYDADYNFHIVLSGDRCKPDEFPCNNDAPLVCIKSSLRCDGRDNCGDRKDEATETASCGGQYSKWLPRIASWEKIITLYITSLEEILIFNSMR